MKPNSSELSYLLYYASTRRSKIQKVGAYLEKKTEADVRKAKTGNVQVTLQILAALIDRTRRDLTLYAPYVLRILANVLASNNLGLVEDSVATFQAFCEHQDVATFGADQYLVRLYEDVVKKYAGFARKQHGDTKQLSRPASFRWRTAGLKAIRSITKSDAIAVDNGRQLRTVIPPILENLYADTEDYVISLYARLENPEAAERDPAKGRASIATQRTSETAEGTTEEADRVAEEEVGILALQCLKQIFSATNRGQVRIGTQAMLVYLLEVVKPAGRERPSTAKTTGTTASMLVGSWATALVQMAARWTPVQDRFIIMVTVMEELVKNPVAEENLEQQLVLVILVDSLLSSSINMIGLSVMDVLLGLVQHILLLLQLGGKGSNILPHHQQTDAIELFATDSPAANGSSADPAIAPNSDEAKDSKLPSTTRKRLLDRLRICLGALANHIYYSDQISDMISALLLRLKPSPLLSNPVAAVENPEAAAQAISNSINMKEDPQTDAFFSFGTARVTALNAIKEILVVANSKASVTGAGAVGRNRVQVQIWEGTQWLLRDEDRRVRRAYVDALITWLRLEMSKHDLSVWEDRDTRKSKIETKLLNKEPARAVSSASRRSKTSRIPKSTFLQLLHLAIYDNAIETPEDESEILLLHLLLYNLVERLGVNSVQHGLPMIVRLQEDINLLDAIATPKAKIVVGSLVHGYFWTLLTLFHFGTSAAAQEVLAEIDRRKQHGIWLLAVEMPPVPLEKIMVAGTANKIRSIDPVTSQTESLLPFDDINALVNQVSLAYNDSIASPPTSPPGSPGKTFNAPILGSGITHRARELPERIRDAMMVNWTKTSCLSSIEAELTRTGSLHGSQRGTLRSLKNGFLHAEGASPRDPSPASDQPPSPSRRSANVGLSASVRAPTMRQSVHGGYKAAKSPTGGDPRASDSNLDGRNITRFEDLKRVLDGKPAGQRSSLPSNPDSADFTGFSNSDRPRVSMSADSDSMVDAEGLDVSDDEAANGKVLRPMSVTSGPTQRLGSGGSTTKNTNRTRSSSTTSTEDPAANARALKGEIVPAVIRNEPNEDPDAVPPVPPLPEGLVGRASVLRPATNDFGFGSLDSVDERPDGVPGDRRSNAQRILSGIDVGEEAGKGFGRPPY